MGEPLSWRVGDRVLSTADHTLVMGILNVTPDSFSDGGRYPTVAAAIEAGVAMVAAGADIVDVGGESTRPGALPVDAEEEIERTMPVVAGLAARDVVVSIDTRHAVVAETAISNGAVIVNDVSGLADPAMRALCAAAGVGVVVMHMQGTPQTMQDDPRYDDVVDEVRRHVQATAEEAMAAGVDRSAVCIDPGIGFGKTHQHNLELLANLDRFVEGGYPVLVGASRKGFLGTIAAAAGRVVDAPERDFATAATTALAIAAGVAVIRAHNVAATVQAARTADAIVRAARRTESWSTTWPG